MISSALGPNLRGALMQLGIVMCPCVCAFKESLAPSASKPITRTPKRVQRRALRYISADAGAEDCAVEGRPVQVARVAARLAEWVSCRSSTSCATESRKIVPSLVVMKIVS